MVRTEKKGTFEFALRPHRVEASTLDKHADVLGMIEILLGVTPRHCRYSYIWPPSYETMSTLVPNLFNVPACDFGVGAIDGGLRSLVAYVVSRSYGCSYCAAHCAGLGTVWRGDGIYFPKNAQAMVPDPDRSTFTRKELAAINIGKKLGPVPTQVVTSADIKDMASVYTVEEQEDVVLCAVLMGYLNRYMDTIGMTLELEPLENSMEHLAATGWTAGISYDEEVDEDLMEEDREAAVMREEKKKATWCGGLGFIKMLLMAKKEGSANLKGIPTSDKMVRQTCLDVAGFAPYYMSGAGSPRRANARSAFVWAFTLRLCRGSEEVPARVKHMMGYICATFAGNTILRAHFAFMVHSHGTPISDLVAITAREASVGDVTIDSEDRGTAAKLAAALALARAASATPSTVTPELVTQIMWLYKPAGVIELITTVSLVTMFLRWTAVYKPEQYEPEILAFVREHGGQLSIDTENSCTDEESGWSATASEIRRG
ncbi:unnamed protein product [Pylaiella littoralis]